MKNFSLLVLIAGIAACGDDAKKSAASNNATNNASNNATNNASNNAPNNLTGADIAEELWALVCDATFDCPSPELLALAGRYPSAAVCKATAPPAFVNFPNFDKIRTRGNTTFDATKAQTCLSAWSASFCESGFTAPVECEEIFVGSLPEGATCVDNPECADGRECDREPNACEGMCSNNCGEFNCLKTEYCSDSGCVQLGGGGADCENLDECMAGLYCISSVCSVGDSTVAGADCQFAGECAGSQVCSNRKCAAFSPPAAGQPCVLGQNSTFCTPGSVCTDLVISNDQLKGTCGPPKKAGGECRIFYECEVGLTCDAANSLNAGVCAALRPNGDACTNQFDCQSGACESDLCSVPTTCQ